MRVTHTINYWCVNLGMDGWVVTFMACWVYMLIACRAGQNRIYAPYMTVYLAISMPIIPYMHRIYRVMANPNCVPSTDEGHACHGVFWCVICDKNGPWDAYGELPPLSMSYSHLSMFMVRYSHWWAMYVHGELPPLSNDGLSSHNTYDVGLF